VVAGDDGLQLEGLIIDKLNVRHLDNAPIT
jgi:hypothetical protein